MWVRPLNSSRRRADLPNVSNESGVDLPKRGRLKTGPGSLRRSVRSALGPGLNAMSPSIAKLGRDISTRMHLRADLGVHGLRAEACYPEAGEP